MYSRCLQDPISFCQPVPLLPSIPSLSFFHTTNIDNNKCERHPQTQRQRQRQQKPQHNRQHNRKSHFFFKNTFAPLPTTSRSPTHNLQQQRQPQQLRRRPPNSTATTTKPTKATILYIAPLSQQHQRSLTHTHTHTQRHTDNTFDKRQATKQNRT